MAVNLRKTRIVPAVFGALHSANATEEIASAGHEN